MKLIYKYPLTTLGLQQVSMPAGARLLTVQIQNDRPTLWALVNTDAPEAPVTIRTVGTGQNLDAEPGRYLGTTQVRGLVWHHFEA